MYHVRRTSAHFEAKNWCRLNRSQQQMKVSEERLKKPLPTYTECSSQTESGLYKFTSWYLVCCTNCKKRLPGLIFHQGRSMRMTGQIIQIKKPNRIVIYLKSILMFSVKSQDEKVSIEKRREDGGIEMGRTNLKMKSNTFDWSSSLGRLRFLKVWQPVYSLAYSTQGK